MGERVLYSKGKRGILSNFAYKKTLAGGEGWTVYHTVHGGAGEAQLSVGEAVEHDQVKGSFIERPPLDPAGRLGVGPAVAAVHQCRRSSEQ